MNKIFFLSIVSLLISGSGCMHTASTPASPEQKYFSPNSSTVHTNTVQPTLSEKIVSSTEATNNQPVTNTTSLPVSTSTSIIEFLLPHNDEELGMFDVYNYIQDIQKKYDIVHENSPWIDFKNKSYVFSGRVQNGTWKKGSDVFKTNPNNDAGENTPTTFSLLHNNKEIEHTICEPPFDLSFFDFFEVAGSPAIYFYYDCKALEDGNFSRREDIYYQGERLNQKYNLTGSKSIFAYKNYVGFVGKNKTNEYVYFNGKIISPVYDQIITYSCCSIASKFELHQNGRLVFLAEKKDKYYLVEIDLNSYLK